MSELQMTRESSIFNAYKDAGVRPRIRRSRAMVVEVDPKRRRLTANMLKSFGYRVHMLARGADALFILHRSPCALVLSDYEMHEIDGYQLGRRIKNQLPQTRIVLMTGLGRQAVADFLEDREIDAWLFKPFGRVELKEILMRFDSSSSMEENTSHSAP
jgi:two-component system NtrC family response regulator